MTPQEAAAVVNGAVFHPDWKLTATAGDGKVKVEARFETWDSSDIDRSGTYWNRITMAPEFEIEVFPAMSPDEVLHRVLRQVDQIVMHEAREFLRVRRDGRWVAPFHPHNWEGVLADAAYSLLERKS